MPFSWLNPARLFAAGGRRPSAPSRRSRVKLNVESLEDRSVPATFNLSGTTLYIFGTAGNDIFTFNKSTTYSGGLLSTTYNFTMNDQTASYTNAQISQVSVFGLGGVDSGYVDLTDTFTIPGNSQQQSLDYTAVGAQGGGYLLNQYNQLFLIFDHFANTYFALNPNEAGYLFTVAGNSSTLVTAGNYSYETGGGEFHYITGTSNLYGYATNPDTDVVYHYDTPGTDTFVASGDTYSYMSGTVNGVAFRNLAIGFRNNIGISSNGGGDLAIYYDSPGNDVFSGYTNYSALSGTDASGNTYTDQAFGFSHSYAYSFMGGTDFAYLYNSTQNTAVGAWHTAAQSAGPRNLPGNG